MAAENFRPHDIEDILQKATSGWQTPPNKPDIIVEDYTHTEQAFWHGTKDDGVILIHHSWDFDRDKLHPKYETRLWTIPLTIYTVTHDNLGDIFDQVREVFDRYTDAPWATSTYGTGTTYSYVGMEKATDIHLRTIPPTIHSVECTVTLLEQFVDVKIA